jgi:hypothetical protein
LIPDRLASASPDLPISTSPLIRSEPCGSVIE